MNLDRNTITSSFSQAAAQYQHHASIQHAIEDILLERLPFIQDSPDVIVDAGCGPGRASTLLQKHFPKALVLSLDFAMPMLKQQRSPRWPWQRDGRLCADMQCMPFQSGSVDLLFTSSALQWCTDFDAVMAEFKRMLAPGGTLLLSTFGAATLSELNWAWSQADDRPHVSEFVRLEQVGDALMRQGFELPVVDVEHFREYYASVRELMQRIKNLGAHNARQNRRKTLTGKSRLLAMQKAYQTLAEEQGIPATWEAIFGMARKPENASPTRGLDADGAVRVDAGSIPIRRKRD